jgi:hypothetical protein
VISLQGIVYMENSRIVEITAKDTSKYHWSRPSATLTVKWLEGSRE